MNNPELAKALRAKADEDRRTKEGAEDHEASELIRVLARVVEGKSLDKAFGAPGDWGYGTPIGDGVLAMLKS